tara:strand:+ start:235 stop:942 length:708 start_codon:yes stop_codon:yes gene_type:complete
MKIQTFIFNWRNQYENTQKKIDQLKLFGKKPIVINSDDEHKVSTWYNIGEESYFTAQMLKALELFNGDVFFHIQADASFNDWSVIYESAEKYFKKYKWGIYAPNVDYTWYVSERTDLDMFNIPEKNLKMVANPDCTCWMIHKDIINEAIKRKIDFSPYKMGWSFDIIYTALSYMMKRPVLRDYAYTIDHPQGTNYNKGIAETEMHNFYQSLPEELQKPFGMIKGDRYQLTEYYKK